MDNFKKAKCKVESYTNNINYCYIPITGPDDIRCSQIITYEDNYPSEELERIPLTRIEIDCEGLIKLYNDSSFSFNKKGHYKITFIVNAYVPQLGIYFDDTKDCVAVGLKETGTDNIYVGGSGFTKEDDAHNMIATGLLSVVDTTKVYELVNLSKRSIYLKTSKLENIHTDSYFVNSPVIVMIDYLGDFA